MNKEKNLNADLMNDQRSEKKLEIEDSKKFPSVVVTSSLLGVDEGIMLKFDFDIGKYVSITETEDIGPDDNYYYSGSAIALDPYLVKQSIGKWFEYTNVEQESVVDDNEPELDPDAKPEPEVWDVADLSVKCDQCGSITKIETITKGIQFIMSTTSESVVELVCPKCTSKLSLFYENGRMFTEDELEVPSKTPEDLDAEAIAKDHDDYLKSQGKEPLKENDNCGLIDEQVEDLSDKNGKFEELLHEELEKSEDLKELNKEFENESQKESTE